MKYIIILTIIILTYGGGAYGQSDRQVVSDTTFVYSGVYVMQLRVKPIEDHYIFGFIPYAEGVSVFPLAVAMALFIVLIFGLIVIIYEKLTIKKKP